LSSKLAEKFKAKGEILIERDLSQHMLFISASSLAATGTPAGERTEEQAQNQTAQLADTLIKELQDADTIIIGAPVYNFGPPASLKAWADLVVRAGTTFRYSENGPEGLLKDKKAYIIAVSGGTPIDADIDFMSGWLKFILGFIGISDVEMIVADGIFGQGGEQKIEAASQAVAYI
jgi:FMN-dependent NADH-azoreductase